MRGTGTTPSGRPGGGCAALAATTGPPPTAVDFTGRECVTYWCQRSSLCSTFCLATQATASGVPTALGAPAEAAPPPTSPPKGGGGVFQNESSLSVVVTRGRSGPCGGVVRAAVAAASVAAATALRHRRRHQQPPCQCWRREFPSAVAPAVAAAVDAERSTMRGSVPGSADRPPPRRVHMACASGVGGTSEVTMAKVLATGARRARMGSSPAPRAVHHKKPGHVGKALELFRNNLFNSVYFQSCAAPFFPLVQVGSLRGLVRCQGPKICVDSRERRRFDCWTAGGVHRTLATVCEHEIGPPTWLT